MDTRDFLVGFVSGVLVTGIIARAFQDFIVGRSPVQLFFKPQRVSTQTRETPAQIFTSCLATILQWLVILILLSGAIVVLWGMWDMLQ